MYAVDLPESVPKGVLIWYSAPYSCSTPPSASSLHFSWPPQLTQSTMVQRMLCHARARVQVVVVRWEPPEPHPLEALPVGYEVQALPCTPQGGSSRAACACGCVCVWVRVRVGVPALHAMGGEGCACGCGCASALHATGWLGACVPALNATGWLGACSVRVWRI